MTAIAASPPQTTRRSRAGFALPLREPGPNDIKVAAETMSGRDPGSPAGPASIEVMRGAMELGRGMCAGNGDGGIDGVGGGTEIPRAAKLAGFGA
jgi:hypothetical protein